MGRKLRSNQSLSKKSHSLRAGFWRTEGERWGTWGLCLSFQRKGGVSSVQEKGEKGGKVYAQRDEIDGEF